MNLEGFFKVIRKNSDFIFSLLFLVFLILAWSFCKDPDGITLAGKVAESIFCFLR